MLHCLSADRIHLVSPSLKTWTTTHSTLPRCTIVVELPATATSGMSRLPPLRPRLLSATRTTSFAARESSTLAKRGGSPRRRCDRCLKAPGSENDHQRAPRRPARGGTDCRSQTDLISIIELLRGDAVACGRFCPERPRPKRAEAAVGLLLILGSRSLEIASGMLLTGDDLNTWVSDLAHVKAVQSGSSTVEAAVEKVKLDGSRDGRPAEVAFPQG